MKYCDRRMIDPWPYNLYDGVDCLAEVHDRSVANARAAGKTPQHSVFKEARAAMTAFWKMVHPGSNFAEEPAVKDIARLLSTISFSTIVFDFLTP